VICRLALGQDSTLDPNLALLDASASGAVVEIQTLLAKRADPNARGDNGTTSLILAAFHGHSEAVKTLLQAGADVNAKDDRGVTALMAAAVNGQADTAETLLAGGADPDIRDNEGRTGLMLAVSESRGSQRAQYRRPDRAYGGGCGRPSQAGGAIAWPRRARRD
jgi:ankyrin repeat protein